MKLNVTYTGWLSLRAPERSKPEVLSVEAGCNYRSNRQSEGYEKRAATEQAAEYILLESVTKINKSSTLDFALTQLNGDTFLKKLHERCPASLSPISNSTPTKKQKKILQPQKIDAGAG